VHLVGFITKKFITFS